MLIIIDLKYLIDGYEHWDFRKGSHLAIDLHHEKCYVQFTVLLSVSSSIARCKKLAEFCSSARIND